FDTLTVTLGAITLTFHDLTTAEAFFSGSTLHLGGYAAGDARVELLFKMTASAGAPAGFGFNYDIRYVRGSPPLPEASTWVMLSFGFGGLAFAGLRRRRSAAICEPDRPRPRLPEKQHVAGPAVACRKRSDSGGRVVTEI